MTRKEFLTALNQYLVTLSPEEKADIISDYEEHFRVGLENGKTEEEIAAALGSPYDAASQFLDGEQPQKPNYAQPQRPNYSAQQSYQQRQGYASQQPNQQRQGYASQQPNQQRQGYASQQPNQQGQGYASQQNYQQPQNDGYVTYDRQDYAPQQSGSRYNTTGIIIVVVLCVILIPTVGSTIVGLLAGLYGAVIGFAAGGVGLITAGATLIPGVSMWVCVGLILMGVSFIALTGLLIMASVEGTKLFIKLIKYCIKECKKMIMEGSF